MEHYLKPDKYYKDIYSIDYKKLKKDNIRYLLFDLDNTIARSYDKLPPKEAIELFKKLQKEGFTTIIISNALPRRAKRYAEKLSSDYYYLSQKPNKKNYLKIIDKYKTNVDEMICIGDQIYTDIKGAKRLGIKSILVDYISKRESLLTIPNRLKEKVFIYKKEVIKRGEYYE